MSLLPLLVFEHAIVLSMTQTIRQRDDMLVMVFLYAIV